MADRTRVAQTLLAKLSSRERRTLMESGRESGKRLSAQALQDDRFVTLTYSDCAATPGTGAVTILLASLTEDPLVLDYVVTNDDDVNVTGSVTLGPEAPDAEDPDEGVVEVTAPNLARGSYRVDFFESGGNQPVASQPIEVLACVTAAVSCQAITFTNPDINPAIEVFYYDTDDLDDEGDSLTLQPGATFRAKTPLTHLSYSTYFESSADTGDDDGGFPLVFALAGEGDVTIDQGCAGPVSGGGGSPDTDSGATGGDDALAATGWARSGPLGFLAGGLLSLAGALVLTRRRRQT